MILLRQYLPCNAVILRPGFARSWSCRDRRRKRYSLTDMECARVRLICTLRYELEIDPDTLLVVLSLVDQLYDTRQRLLSLAQQLLGPIRPSNCWASDNRRCRVS